MKISIIGYTGFLGKKILEKFISKEKEYTVNKINIRSIDFTSNESLENLLSKYMDSDIIINCAAALKPKNKYDDFLNEDFPACIERIIEKNKSNALFIHFSSINTILKMRRDKYSLSKKKAEEKLNKNKTLIIRLPFLLEKNDNIVCNSGNLKTFYNYLNIKFLPFYPMIYPGHIYQPVELDKLIDYIEILILNKSQKNKVLNIIGDNNKSLWDLFEQIARIKKRRILKINIKIFTQFMPKFLINSISKKSNVLQHFLSIDHSQFNEGKTIL